MNCRRKQSIGGGYARLTSLSLVKVRGEIWGEGSADRETKREEPSAELGTGEV